MPYPVGVVGFGQTDFVTRRPDVSTPELIFEATSRALADANCNSEDIDAVVFASAPEVFEGVHEPDRWCVAALGGGGKPVYRIHTGGATGGSGPLAATRLIQAGMHETVLVVGLQRTSEAADAQAIFTTIFDPVFERDIQLNVITTIGMMASRQMAYFGLTEDHMAWVSTKNFGNALRNPYAHLKLDIDEQDVKESKLLAWPIRMLHSCPRTDGAAAVVMTGERWARTASNTAWVIGFGCAADVYRIGDRIHEDGTDFAGQRALKWAAQKAYDEAGIREPRKELDVVEVYAPFSNIEIATYEELGFADIGKGWQLVEEEATSMEGDIPFVPSGGCMATNPIGATGVVRFGEAALQVMGRAGDHQVDGARRALATATGGINQFFTAAVLSDTPGKIN